MRKVWLYTSNAPHIDDHCILLNAFKTQKVNMARPCRCMMGMELPWSLQQIMPYYQCITLHLFIGKHKLFSNLMITYKINNPHMKLNFVFVGAFKFSMVLAILIKYIIYIYIYIPSSYIECEHMWFFYMFIMNIHSLKLYVNTNFPINKIHIWRLMVCTNCNSINLYMR